jgi:hypothetical protein
VAQLIRQNLRDEANHFWLSLIASPETFFFALTSLISNPIPVSPTSLSLQSGATAAVDPLPIRKITTS